MDYKVKNLNIRLREEHLNIIKEMAKQENLNVTDFVIYKILNLKPVITDEIRKFPDTKIDKKTGKEKNFIRKYVVTKKEYLPADEVSSAPEAVY